MRWFGLLLLLAACDCDSIDATDATDEPDRDGGADAATPDLGTDDAGVDAGPRDFGPGGGFQAGSIQRKITIGCGPVKITGSITGPISGAVPLQKRLLSLLWGG